MTRIKINSFSNNIRQVISCNNAAGPLLLTNAVSIMQCIFFLTVYWAQCSWFSSLVLFR